MEAEPSWRDYRRWHEILDAVCVAEGHHDNAALANELCAASGNRSGEAFEAALRNLRNWRSGTHLPQRRNFVLLTKVLHVDAHQGLKDNWVRLYAEARGDRSSGEIRRASAAPTGKGVRLAMMFAALAALTTGAVYVLNTGSEVVARDRQPADANYRKAVSLSVGESIVVHGARGKCDQAPPAWEKVIPKLPDLTIGHWSEGIVAARYSRKCGGPTAARGIVFNATKSGQAEILLFGDPVTIEVY